MNNGLREPPRPAWTDCHFPAGTGPADWRGPTTCSRAAVGTVRHRAESAGESAGETEDQGEGRRAPHSTLTRSSSDGSVS